MDINALFASPGDLSELEAVRERTKLFIRVLDAKIQAPVQLTETERRAIDRVKEAPKNLDTVLTKVYNLQEKATTTEASIQGMTREIERLDGIKANLIQSITMLRRLQMLATAFDQLVANMRDRNYTDIVQMLPAVSELMQHFRLYRTIDEVAKLSKEVSDTETALAQQIMSDFSLATEKKSSISHEDLRSSCSILEQLPGQNYKQQLTTWYCTVVLKEYRSIFRTGDEAGALENLSRRYAYFKRILRDRADELKHFFPQSWRMVYELTQAFCTTTQTDLQTMLAQVGRAISVPLLVQSLQETVEFESYLDKKVTPDLKKPLSLAFQPYLNLWVEHHDRLLEGKMESYRTPSGLANETSTSRDQHFDDSEHQRRSEASDSVSTSAQTSSESVLPSSTDLVHTYRQIFAQTAKLTTGPPLLDMAMLFGKWLTRYSEQVIRRIIPARIQSSDDIQCVCMAISTADYLTTTTQQLQDRLGEHLDEDLKDKLSFDNSMQSFSGIISMCIGLLVSRIQSQCAMAWREMANTNWSRLETVGDMSGFVGELVRSLESSTQEVLAHLPTSKHQFFSRLVCDRLLTSVVSEFLATAAMVSPVSEVAAEQMLLDLYVIKETLLVLPMNGDNTTLPSAPSIYTRRVNSLVNSLANILKIIMTPADPEDGFVQSYVVLIADKSPDNVLKVLELKGVPRNLHARYIELFYSQIKARDDLAENAELLKALNLANPTAAFEPAPSPNPGSLSPNLSNQSSNQGSRTSSLTLKSNGHLLSKEGFERFDHNRIGENLRTFGRFLRREGNSSPGPR